MTTVGSGMSRVLPPLTATPRSPQPAGEISDAESRDRVEPHAGVAEDEKNCDVAGAPALARGPDTPPRSGGASAFRLVLRFSKGVP